MTKTVVNNKIILIIYIIYYYIKSTRPFRSFIIYLIDFVQLIRSWFLFTYRRSIDEKPDIATKFLCLSAIRMCWISSKHMSRMLVANIKYGFTTIKKRERKYKILIDHWISRFSAHNDDFIFVYYLNVSSIKVITLFDQSKRPCEHLDLHYRNLFRTLIYLIL